MITQNTRTLRVLHTYVSVWKWYFPNNYKLLFWLSSLKLTHKVIYNNNYIPGQKLHSSRGMSDSALASSVVTSRLVHPGFSLRPQISLLFFWLSSFPVFALRYMTFAVYIYILYIYTPCSHHLWAGRIPLNVSRVKCGDEMRVDSYIAVVKRHYRWRNVRAR